MCVCVCDTCGVMGWLTRRGGCVSCDRMKQAEQPACTHARTPVSSVTQSLGVMNVCRRITEPAAFTCTFERHKQGDVTDGGRNQSAGSEPHPTPCTQQPARTRLSSAGSMAPRAASPLGHMVRAVPSPPRRVGDLFCPLG